LQLRLLLPQMFWFFQASTNPLHLRKPHNSYVCSLVLLLNCFDYSKSLQNPLHLKMPCGFFFSSFIWFLNCFDASKLTTSILYISESLIIYMFTVWFTEFLPDMFWFFTNFI
jgi:hypothetical protein